jgi:hypothetical protein
MYPRVQSALAIALLVTTAHAQAPPTACNELPLAAIEAHKRTINEARRVLGHGEVDCALSEVSMPVPGCELVKAAATSDPEKRRLWTEAMLAWSELDRLLLAARKTEDRLGIVCLER